jgi:hypothetical protein
MGLNDTRELNINGTITLSSKANFANWKLNTTSKIDDFEWDLGNIDHIMKHSFKPKECEDTFLNKPIFISKDKSHSQVETRYKLMGRTSENRKSIVVFTIRKKKIRVISARDQNKNERKTYQNLGGEKR